MHEARAQRADGPVVQRLAAKMATVDLPMAIHRIADDCAAGVEEDGQAHEPASNRLAEPIDAHVHDRLDRALLGRRYRRVEELVARAEPRTP